VEEVSPYKKKYLLKKMNMRLPPTDEIFFYDRKMNR